MLSKAHATFKSNAVILTVEQCVSSCNWLSQPIHRSVQAVPLPFSVTATGGSIYLSNGRKVRNRRHHMDCQCYTMEVFIQELQPMHFHLQPYQPGTNTRPTHAAVVTSAYSAACCNIKGNGYIELLEVHRSLTLSQATVPFAAGATYILTGTDGSGTVYDYLWAGKHQWRHHMD